MSQKLPPHPARVPAPSTCALFFESLERRMLLSGEAVTHFVLVNAETDQFIGELADGAVINFRALGTRKLNVVAETAGDTQSLRFGLDSKSNFRTENSAPFSLAGDTDGDFKPWTPSLGTHTLKGTPFTGPSGSGTAGTALQISFLVVDEPVGDPVELQASASSISFGDVIAGSFQEVTLTLWNPEEPGGASVTVQSTSISGSGFFSDNYSDAPLILGPGQETTLTVRFAPTAEGSFSGSLNILHSGTNNPLSIALSGSAAVSNHAPVLAAIGNKTLAPGGSLSIAVSATDQDGDQITLSAANLPVWASFTDNGGGSGTLVLSPPLGTTGTFSGLTIAATDNGDPVMSDSETFSVTVADNSVVVYGLTLINAETDQPVATLVNGGQINFALAGTNKLNIRADTSAGTVSVRFGYDSNNNFRTENSKPFSFAGDTSGDYKAWTPTLGAHVISATPFSGSSGSGTAGPKLTINVTVVQGAYLVASPANPSFSIPQGGATGGGAITLSAQDGAQGVAYAATSDSLWLTLGAGSGTTADPLVLGVNTSGLAIGTHVGYITVTSPTHGGVRIPVTLNVTGAFIADHVHLSFVQDPSTTLSVVWRTMNAGTQPLVEYRALGEGTWLSTSGAIRTSGTSGQLFETLLSGLSPATTYEYRVRGDGGTWSQVYTTRTMPAMGPADFSAIYFADTGLIGRTDGLDTGTAQTIAEIQRLAPDLLLAGGDYAYFNTDKRFGSLEATIDAWFNQNQPIFSSIPVMPTYGNHEVLLGEGYAQWAARFATPEGWNNRQNYSFDVGDAHFVSIMAVSETAALSTSSFNWLVSDLAAAQAAGRKWSIPFFHVSPFSDGSSHSSNLALRAQLGPVFEQYGVKVALMSHDQSFERTYPLTGVANNITRTSTALTGYGPNDGVTWLKVSPAGKLSNKSGADNFSKFQTHPAPFWTAVRDDTMHHFSRLVFSADGRLRIESYGFPGDGSPMILMDSFEYSLGAAAMGGGEGGGGEEDSGDSGDSGNGGFWGGRGWLTGLFDDEKEPSDDEEPDPLAGEAGSELV